MTCPHCGQPAQALIPVLFGDGVDDVACLNCIKAWVAEFPGWTSQQVKDALKGYTAHDEVKAGNATQL